MNTQQDFYKAAEAQGASITDFKEEGNRIEFDACCVGHAQSLALFLLGTATNFSRTGIHFVVSKDLEPKYKIESWHARGRYLEIEFVDAGYHSINLVNLHENRDSLEFRVAKTYFGSDEMVPVSACAIWRNTYILWIAWTE